VVSSRMKGRRKIVAAAGISVAVIAAIAGSLLIWLPSQSPLSALLQRYSPRDVAVLLPKPHGSEGLDTTSSDRAPINNPSEPWPTEASQSAKHEYQSSPPSNTRSVTEERAVQHTPMVATAPKPGLSADQEVACREKLRSRGIYLIAGNPCIDIDLIIKNLAEGTYSFNKPDSAYVEEPFRVVLTLTTAPDQDVSSVFLGTEGKVTAKQGQFAQHLEARLRGGIDFKVDPSGPQEQTVTSLNPVVWEWSVTPLKPGNKTIFIDVAANLILGTQQEHVQLKTLDERIEIRVSILHFILAAVTSLWGVALGIATMIIAILGVVHYSRSLRRMREHRDGDPDEPPPVELITHQQSHSESSATHSSSA
jgi:hypothetical protein